MKILNITNITELLKTIDERCEGDVYLVTGEGDRLNLKSKITQYVAFSGMFNDTRLKETTIECSISDDYAKILDFLIRG